MRLFAFFLTLVVVAFVGMLIGYVLKAYFATRDANSISAKVAKMRAEAEAESSKLFAAAREKAAAIIERATNQAEKLQSQIQEEQQRLSTRQELTQKREQEIENSKHLIEDQKTKLDEIHKKKIKELQAISGISAKEAHRQLVTEIEKQAKQDLFSRMEKIEAASVEEIEKKAQSILVSAIHRLGNSVENDIMSVSVKLANDDEKGKIIGKEGRNIKTFEKASGVQLVIDDTPNVITISCFDPIRRAIAKTALEKLIKSGRIQPARIEQAVEKARNEINALIEKKGKDAAAQVGIKDLHPELLSLLGQLYFRYSYGQNVLQHSVEMAHIAGVLAAEVGADVYVAKAGALLHDIGKATDHSDTGTHVDIGIRILRRYALDEEVIKAMAAHHEEYPYENLESKLVQVADAISGGRPGARSDTAGMYIKKLEGLERIATSIKGVTSAYAVSAGREVRIFVDPGAVDDYQAKKIAKTIADQVEAELKYPGEIKINVIRESRVTEYAR